MYRPCTFMCKYTSERKWSNFMGYLKGRSAIRIFEKYPELKKKWHNEFWTTGYYVTTVGDITEEAVKKYIYKIKKMIKKLVE